MNKRQKLTALLSAGWKKRPAKETDHEPVYLIDPLGLVGYCPRIDEAYNILERRKAHGIK